METFVVRLWVPGRGERARDPELRGLVVHSASGRTSRFTGGSELIQFLSEPRQEEATGVGAGAAPASSPPGSPNA